MIYLAILSALISLFKSKIFTKLYYTMDLFALPVDCH